MTPELTDIDGLRQPNSETMRDAIVDDPESRPMLRPYCETWYLTSLTCHLEKEEAVKQLRYRLVPAGMDSVI